MRNTPSVSLFLSPLAPSLPCHKSVVSEGFSSIEKSSDSVSGRIEQKNIMPCKHFARMRVVLYVSEAKKQKKQQPRKEQSYGKAFAKDLKTIYNAIESLNATYRKLNRQRSVFPSDQALLKALYLSTFEATKKWTMPLRNWGRVYGELQIMYEGRLPE